MSTMDEFPANSKKVNKPKPPTTERPKVEKIVTTEAVKLKKGFGQKFKETFLGGEFTSARRYIATDVLLPALRNLIVDATSKGVERLIYGESYRRRPHEPGRPRMAYNNPVSRYSHAQRPGPTSGPMLPDQPPLAVRPRDASDVVLTNRDEAELVIERLTDIIDQYQIASVADLYDLVGLPTTYVDQNWGWTNLAFANIRQIREGYLIELPPVESIQ